MGQNLLLLYRITIVFSNKYRYSQKISFIQVHIQKYNLKHEILPNKKSSVRTYKVANFKIVYINSSIKYIYIYIE